MERIQDLARFQQLRAAGEGYIYNDFSIAGASGAANNVLHEASCRELERANLGVRKYFDSNLERAVSWLNLQRPENWKPCGTCRPPVPT